MAAGSPDQSVKFKVAHFPPAGVVYAVALACYPQKSMPTDQILALLVAERDKLNKAIEALGGPTKRMGRPPKTSVAVPGPAAPTPKKKRRKFSAAQREAAAERMRQRWATKKKAEAKSQPKPASKPKKKAKAA